MKAHAKVNAPWRYGTSNEPNRCYGKVTVGEKVWKRIEVVLRIEELCSDEIAHSCHGTSTIRRCVRSVAIAEVGGRFDTPMAVS
jgi:hypothetical protein